MIVVVTAALLIGGCSRNRASDRTARNAETTVTTQPTSLSATSAASLAEALAGLPEPPYSEGTGLAIDARRLFDVMALQASLLRYRMAEKRYPPSLNELLPAHAPIGADGRPRSDLPVDPLTRQPYEYRVVKDGGEYEIAVVLSNARRFTGFDHRTPG